MLSKFTLSAQLLAASLTLSAAPTVLADCGNAEFCRVSGVESHTDNNRLNAHISPSRDSSIKFGLREGDEVRNRGCKTSRGQRWCKVEMPDNRYQFGWVLDSYLREARSGSGYDGGTSSEYKRGYNDALKGKRFDTDRHPQDYKDGYRGGEEASRGGSRRGSSGDEYDINRLSNGDFEIVWTQGDCIATANRRGEILRFNEQCTDDLTERSRNIARRER